MNSLKFKIVFFCSVLMVHTAPTSPANDQLPDYDILKTLTQQLLLVGRIPRDDEGQKNGIDITAGVTSIILGVLTGDIRRIIEDGAFRFLPKPSETVALKTFANLLQKSSTEATTTTTPKPSTKSNTAKVATTVDPDDDDADAPEEGSVTATSRSTKRPPLNYKFARTTTAKAVVTTTTVTPNSDNGEEEEELADQFEKALQPYLPSNPDSLIPSGIPEFV